MEGLERTAKEQFKIEFRMTTMVTANPELSANLRLFLDGSHRSVSVLASAAIGWGEYLPGWRWSEHAGKQTGKSSESHIGYILSGQLKIQSAEGQETVVHPGDAFEIGAAHDAWVVGDAPCVALDFEHLGLADGRRMEELKG